LCGNVGHLLALRVPAFRVEFGNRAQLPRRH
jgi:hypothetical protein